jgi:hypothetical protein
VGDLVVLEILFALIFDVVIYGVVYIVSYHSGKILILVFTLGRYSSEPFNRFAKSGWLKSPFLVPTAKENKNCISFNYTCNIGFVFWIVSVTTFIIVK